MLFRPPVPLKGRLRLKKPFKFLFSLSNYRYGESVNFFQVHLIKYISLLRSELWSHRAKEEKRTLEM